MIEIRWDWIVNHLDDVVEKTWQHIQLLVIPMVAGFLIALALAVLAMRRPGTIGPVTAITGLLYTIPALAAFAVLRPILGLSLATALPLITRPRSSPTSITETVDPRPSRWYSSFVRSRCPSTSTTPCASRSKPDLLF